MPSRRTSHRAFGHSVMGHRTLGAASLAASLLALALAGCSAGDVEFNGKIFDAVGATGLVGKPSGQARMAERQPLIVPPALDRLPQPGSGMPAGADATASLVDPEKAKVLSAAELDRRQEAYCKEHYELAKMRGDRHAESASGPAGPCRKSAFEAFSKWNKADTPPEPTETADQGAVTPSTTTGSIGTVTEAAPPTAKRGR